MAKNRKSKIFLTAIALVTLLVLVVLATSYDFRQGQLARPSAPATLPKVSEEPEPIRPSTDVALASPEALAQAETSAQSIATRTAQSAAEAASQAQASAKARAASKMDLNSKLIEKSQASLQAEPAGPAKASGASGGALRVGTTVQSKLKAAAPAPISKLAKASNVGGCYTVSYKHNPTQGHINRASCSRHDNILPFELTSQGGAVNRNSVCLRVDGTPAHYALNAGLIKVGPFAGPDSVITLRYCTGAATCLEDCKLPKDSFMTALGANSNEAQLGAGATAEQRWIPTAAAEDLDLKKELGTELGSLAESNQPLTEFRGWSSSPAIATSCGKKVAGR